MNNFLVHFKKLDWALITATLFLVGIGLASIYSSSLGREDFLNFKKQLIFFGLGLFLMFLFSFFDYRILRNDPYLILIIYLFGLISLAGLFFLAPEVRGVKSWYKIGPIYLDPMEFVKIILIIILAKYFSMRHIQMYQIRHIFLSGFYVLLPGILILLQPDLGSVIVLSILWIIVLIISGIKIRHFLFLCFCSLLILILSWSFLLKDYHKERIFALVVPHLEPLGVSWSQNQAKIAIGSGGFFGQGLGKGSQTQYGFLSEPQTDFIFASIAEEMGLAGTSFLLVIFLFLIWRIFKIALNCQTNFPRLFASGFGILLMVQIFINIGMNLGLAPVIGIPLPLVSYGGSSLVATFIGLGILQSIKINQ